MDLNCLAAIVAFCVPPNYAVGVSNADGVLVDGTGVLSSTMLALDGVTTRPVEGGVLFIQHRQDATGARYAVAFVSQAHLEHARAEGYARASTLYLSGQSASLAKAEREISFVTAAGRIALADLIAN